MGHHEVDAVFFAGIHAFEKPGKHIFSRFPFFPYGILSLKRRMKEVHGDLCRFQRRHGRFKFRVFKAHKSPFDAVFQEGIDHLPVGPF